MGRCLVFGVLQGRAEVHASGIWNPRHRMKLGWEPWFRDPCLWQFPWISDGCGNQELLSHSCQLPGCLLAVTNNLSTPPAELLVPLFPSISALTGTSLGLGTAGGADHSWLLVESRQLPGHKQLPCCLHKLVSICHVWWHPRAFQNYPGAVDAALSGKGALLAWSI